MTNETERLLLLSIARAAITAKVSRTPAPAVPLEGAPGRPGGAFVTLHRRGSLRGCIGRIEGDAPLGHTIAHCAVAAATSDPRFPPVRSNELDELHIELSLLGELEPVAAFEDIAVGVHGLVVQFGWRRGLLLPQVASERQWDAERFVVETCRKAGLSPDAWQQGAAIFKFAAEVFAEPAAHDAVRF